MRLSRMTVLFFALCSSVTVFGQKGTWFIGADGGVSLPLGNFGKSSTASSLMSTTGTIGDNHGYANTGGFFSVDGAYFFCKHFGIGGMFKYGSYNLKGVDSLSQGYEESFDVDTTRTSVTDYKMWSIMPGLYFNEQLIRGLDLTARVMAGIAHASTPNITVGIEDGQVFDPSVIQQSASRTSFAADAGLGLAYRIYRGLDVHVRADYFYTKPDFTITNSNRNNNAGRLVTDYNQALASVNFSAGIAYHFGHKK